MEVEDKPPTVSVGELLWDLLPSGPRLGGTTANFAILSARLGDRVTLVSRVGRDELGVRAMEELCAVARESGGRFDVGGVQWSETLPTGTVEVRLDRARVPLYTIREPVAWDEICMSEPLLERARGAAAICFGTLAQREQTSRATMRSLVEATGEGCVRVCDVNLRMPFCTAETMAWCLKNATVLKVSSEEMQAVGALVGSSTLGRQVAGEEDDAAELLRLAPGCAMVAITLGADGSLLARREETHRHAGYPVRVVDTVGAGDAFTAGMVHATLRGAGLAQINTVSNLCGSYVAGRAGATPEVSAELLEAIGAVLGP